ncbi:hypothetical protein N8329_07225, partial [Crocinitomicaceae bacterium]|nr:hypothetical protein [Crocinitomicaceae bacterium]
PKVEFNNIYTPAPLKVLMRCIGFFGNLYFCSSMFFLIVPIWYFFFLFGIGHRCFTVHVVK